MFDYGLLRNIKVLTIINTALSIILILSLLIFVRDLLTPTRNIQSSKFKVQNSKSKVQRERTLKDFESIVKNNPFGFPGGELKPLRGAEESLSFDMRLIGTVSGGSDYAIFLTKDGKQEVFKRGERVFNSGRLERVYKDKVIISKEGKRSEIPLSDILTVETIRPESGAQSFVRSLGKDFIVNQEGILHALENPARLMTDARLQPNYVNGIQEGFMLREVRNGGIYESLGLQNGDVLLRINNYDITNPEIALQALTALKGMDRVALDIIRNGARMTLNYQIR